MMPKPVSRQQTGKPGEGEAFGQAVRVLELQVALLVLAWMSRGGGHPCGALGCLLQPERAQEEKLCISETADLTGCPRFPREHSCDTPNTTQHAKRAVSLRTSPPHPPWGREGAQPPTTPQTGLLLSSCCSRSATSSPPAAQTWPLCACP